MKYSGKTALSENAGATVGEIGGKNDLHVIADGDTGCRFSPKPVRAGIIAMVEVARGSK